MSKGKERHFTADQRNQIAAAVRKRQRELGLDNRHASRRLGMGYSTYCALQAGFPQVTTYTRAVRMKVATGFGWVSNWPEVIVRGGDPMFRKEQPTTGIQPVIAAPKPVVATKPVDVTSAIDANAVVSSLSAAITAVLGRDINKATTLVAGALQQLNPTQQPARVASEGLVAIQPAPYQQDPVFTPAPSVLKSRRHTLNGPTSPALTGERLARFNAEVAAQVKTAEELARDYNIGLSTAKKYMAKVLDPYGVQKNKRAKQRNRSGGKVGRPSALTHRQLAFFNAEALARKKTIMQLALSYNIGYQTAAQYAARVRKEQELSAGEMVNPTLM